MHLLLVLYFLRLMFSPFKLNPTSFKVLALYKLYINKVYFQSVLGWRLRRDTVSSLLPEIIENRQVKQNKNSKHKIIINFCFNEVA